MRADEFVASRIVGAVVHGIDTESPLPQAVSCVRYA
jgi:hypothetical protein